MSLALYGPAGLRFWTEREIEMREQITRRLVGAVSRPLLDLNQMWRIERVETPLMMPRSEFSCAYDDRDVFVLQSKIAGEDYALRAETTNGTYLMAQHLMRSTSRRDPICFYQAGQSFRQEYLDGATAAKLRFNSFWQLEFQLIYGKSTTAPIPEKVRASVLDEIRLITGLESRLEASDRLPSYAEETIDIECLWTRSHEGAEPEWKEVASTSARTDWPQKPDAKYELKVFEVAIGLDRLVVMALRGL